MWRRGESNRVLGRRGSHGFATDHGQLTTNQETKTYLLRMSMGMNQRKGTNRGLGAVERACRRGMVAAKIRFQLHSPFLKGTAHDPAVVVVEDSL